MFQLFVYFFTSASKGQLVGFLFVVVVSILPGYLPESGIALYTDKIFESIHPFGYCYTCLTILFIISHRLCIDFKHRFVSIFQFPNQHKSYQDRIADFVVYFDWLNIQIAGTQRKFLFVHEWIYPIKPCLRECAFVFSKKYHDPGFVRLLGNISGKH